MLAGEKSRCRKSCLRSTLDDVMVFPRKPAVEEPNIAAIRTVIVKEGMPSVEQARARLQTELLSARQSGVRVLKLVHGYGSSGIGGDLRISLQSTLSQLAQQRRAHVEPAKAHAGIKKRQRSRQRQQGNDDRCALIFVNLTNRERLLTYPRIER